MLSVKTTTLPNGLRVVVVEQPHLHSANVSFLVRCGSRHESQSEWGLTHLVEHMLFRGTKHFPDTRSLARAFERHGGYVNASTWRDHTALSTAIHPSRITEAFHVLSDMVLHPAFRDLEVERAIVEEELRADLDEDGEDTDLNNASRAAVWAGHAMGRRITGSFDTLRSFSEEAVRHHHARHYTARNSVLCVAGKIDADVVHHLAEQAFGALPPGVTSVDGERTRFAPSSRFCLHDRDGSQLAVLLSFEAVPYGDPDYLAQGLLARVLDDGVTSRLQDALLQKHGLLYDFSTGLDSYLDCGVYDIEMRVAPRRATTALATTLEVLSDLLARGVRDEEVELAKERTVRDLEFGIDSAEELGEQYAVAEMFGRAPSYDEEIERVSSVTPEHIMAVAQRIFCRGGLHLTLMGPVQRANLDRMDELISGFEASTGRHRARPRALRPPIAVGKRTPEVVELNPSPTPTSEEVWEKGASRAVV